MALLIGPLKGPQTTQEAVSAAFAGQATLAPRHVHLSPFELPDEPGVEAWAWAMVPGAPTVLDLGATRFEMNDQGRVVFPSGDEAHPRIERGIVLWVEDIGRWVIVAADDQGGQDLELAMLGIDHVDQWLAGNAIPGWCDCGG